MRYERAKAPLGQTIGIEDGQPILDAALRAGIDLPQACAHGLCARGKVQAAAPCSRRFEARARVLTDYPADARPKDLTSCRNAASIGD
jgi:phenol hydroxylase P5 protein